MCGDLFEGKEQSDGGVMLPTQTGRFSFWWERMIETAGHAEVGVFESPQLRPREFRIAIRL